MEKEGPGNSVGSGTKRTARSAALVLLSLCPPSLLSGATHSSVIYLLARGFLCLLCHPDC
ncbi:hypothetical protein BT69DRAFT_1282594 [Atractiella rhizophila]|nr:hypothetical protein BT69DRAFT_1282594 [Atractiella rhizophila]